MTRKKERKQVGAYPWRSHCRRVRTRAWTTSCHVGKPMGCRCGTLPGTTPHRPAVLRRSTDLASHRRLFSSMGCRCTTRRPQPRLRTRCPYPRAPRPASNTIHGATCGTHSRYAPTCRGALPWFAAPRADRPATRCTRDLWRQGRKRHRRDQRRRMRSRVRRRHVQERGRVRGGDV